MDYTPQELMVAAAAREIRDGEVVFVGMRLPLLAFVLAKRTHAPSAVGLFESGLMRDEPSPELLYTMCDPPNIFGASWCTRMINLMALLQQGATGPAAALLLTLPAVSLPSLAIVAGALGSYRVPLVLGTVVFVAGALAGLAFL